MMRDADFSDDSISMTFVNLMDRLKIVDRSIIYDVISSSRLLFISFCY